MEAPSPNIAQLRQTLLACLLQRVPSLGVSILGWAGAVSLPSLTMTVTFYTARPSSSCLQPGEGRGRGGALTQILFALFSTSDAASAVCRYQAAIISVASFYSISNELCRHLDILPHTLNSNEVSSTETCQTCLLLLRCRAAQH